MFSARVALSWCVPAPNGNAGTGLVIVQSSLVYKSGSWSILDDADDCEFQRIMTKRWMVVVGRISPISLPWVVCGEDPPVESMFSTLLSQSQG